MSLFEDLKWRGLIKDIAGEESELQKVLDGKPFSFYWGTDPTADSLHIGHYSSLCMAKRLANAGHHPVLLCGGATGRIGDPRPTAEREIISEETVNKNIKGLQAQVSKIVPQAEVVDNYDWLKGYSFLNFLRDVGKYINVNYMLDKDIIRRRLENGITYAEFSYMLMQGYDFVHLYQEKNCIMEVAGSDQWGNITTGVDLIRKMLDKQAYAFTMPLILDATGKKFGKSEGNALWLDKNKTSAYEIYQYLINSDDSKVIEYLKVFTFLSREEIEKIEEQQKAALEVKEASPAESSATLEVTPAQEEAVDINFIADSLKNLKKFTVNEINQEWVKQRYTEWAKERGGTEKTQLQSETDADNFLAPFYSKCTGSWWSENYADAITKALPDNSAKNIVVWNPGCAKGYETYSLACILKKRYPDAKIRIYGHDTDLLSVSNAPLMNLTDSASADWYQPYTARTASGDYTFSKEIKDSIMFEYHDCVNTNNLPPIDIVFARDLLSFLPETSQKKVLDDFSEKVKGNGVIIIGENENIALSGWNKKQAGDVAIYSKQ